MLGHAAGSWAAGARDGSCHVSNALRAPAHNLAPQALSDAQQFLFEERQRLLALQAENDELKLQELEDRRRMQHLLSVANPLEQGLHLRPGGGALTGSFPAGGSPGKQGQQQGQGQGGVLRTVFLPAANADALVLKIESLQAQLNEQVRRPWTLFCVASQSSVALCQLHSMQSSTSRCSGAALDGAAAGAATPCLSSSPICSAAVFICWRAKQLPIICLRVVLNSAH